MLELYPEIRLAHILAVALSGGWTGLRGVALLAGMRWPRHVATWAVALTIDATLLTVAVLLLTILPAELFANQWLNVKLLFVGLYVLAGYIAFIVPETRRGQAALLLLAAAAFAIAFGIARAHHPLGWLAGTGLAGT